MPTVETFEAADRKEVLLADAKIYQNMPKYHCYNCILDFNKELKEPAGSDNGPLELEEE